MLNNCIRFISTLLVVVGTVQASGQQYLADYLFLKNGDIYTGKIDEQPPRPGVIGITTFDGCYRVLADSVIERQTMDSVVVFITRVIHPSKQAGYFNHSRAGILTGKEEWNENTILSFQMVNGYRFRFPLSVGAGLGYEKFDVGVIQLFGECSYRFLLSGAIRPFVSAYGGYSASTGNPPPTDDYYAYDQKSKNGWLAGAFAGVEIGINTQTAFTFSAGYRYQRLDYSETRQIWWGNPQTVDITKEYNRLMLSVGLIFR